MARDLFFENIKNNEEQIARSQDNLTQFEKRKLLYSI